MGQRALDVHQREPLVEAPGGVELLGNLAGGLAKAASPGLLGFLAKKPLPVAPARAPVAPGPPLSVKHIRRFSKHPARSIGGP
ncbi:MAG: hypothetical protein N2318_01800 [Meiothermus sp.]|nr:hypothetical protein [Meiothermus sp.]